MYCAVFNLQCMKSCMLYICDRTRVEVGLEKISKRFKVKELWNRNDQFIFYERKRR